MLLSEKVALDMIGRANIAGGMKTLFLRDSGIVVTREPFFRSMLLAIYKTRLNDLIRKARIAIPQSYGRLMVGVLDETGTLNYGQVFIRYTKNIGEPDEFVTRKGPVMVTKNPCFHPGLLMSSSKMIF
jgi:RNA-dependent RNA polymerase